MLEEIDDALGFRWKVRQAGEAGGGASLVGEKRRQRGDPDPRARQAEEVAASHAQAVDAHCLVTISSILSSTLATAA